MIKSETVEHEAIRMERKRQVAKWGEEPYPSNDVAMRVLVEEVGEVAQALNDREPVRNLYAELSQVAAVCVRWMSALRQDEGTRSILECGGCGEETCQWCLREIDRAMAVVRWEEATECDTPVEAAVAREYLYKWLHQWQTWGADLLKHLGLAKPLIIHGDTNAREKLDDWTSEAYALLQKLDKRLGKKSMEGRPPDENYYIFAEIHGFLEKWKKAS